MTKEKKKILNYRINITLNKLKKFSKENNNSKKYELFNIVSETGDSIYSPPFEELTNSEGKVFISVDKLNEIVQKELKKHLDKGGDL